MQLRLLPVVREVALTPPLFSAILTEPAEVPPGSTEHIAGHTEVSRPMKHVMIPEKRIDFRNLLMKA